MASTEPLTVDTSTPDQFNLGPRFTHLRPIGYGFNGLVVAATDNVNSCRVAIKRLVAGSNDSGRCRQVLREVRILRRLSHDNVVKVHDILRDGSQPLDSEGRSSSVYIVQELMTCDLEQLMACGGRLKEEHSRLLFYQLLRALKYVHSANVLHRDVKPANLLVDPATLLLKLADFSLARVLDPAYSHQGHLTETMGTTWYQAPELILAARLKRFTRPPQHMAPSKAYTSAVDIWAAGCVLGEMLSGGRPLLAATRDVQQMRLIIDAIALTPDDWRHLLAVMPNRMLRRHPMRVCRPLASRCRNASPAAVDLLKRLLTFDPSKRMSAEAGLSHPFVSLYGCASDEPVARSPLRVELEVDNFELTTLRDMIYNESVLVAPPSCGSCESLTLTNATQNSPQRTAQCDGRTLEEIMGLDGGVGEPQMCDVMRRNLRNCGEWASGLIEAGEPLPPRKPKSNCEMEGDCEKDVADVSLAKQEEDRDLELAITNSKVDTDSQKEIKDGGGGGEKEVGSREKVPRKRSPPKQRSQKEAYANSAELDDRYRLPTAHLRRDCDYSNERIKRYYRSRWARRDQCCRRGDGSGTDDAQDRDLETRLQCLDIGRNKDDVTPRTPGGATVTHRRSSSSPEELASSRDNRRGARPKKISKKQRAL